MYGGSGTLPALSRSSATVLAEPAARRTRYSPPPSTSMTRAEQPCSSSIVAFGLKALLDWPRQIHSSASGDSSNAAAPLAPAGPMSKSSTAPPLFSFLPSNRAGRTRASFSTRRSEGRKRSGRSRNCRWQTAAVEREIQNNLEAGVVVQEDLAVTPSLLGVRLGAPLTEPGPMAKAFADEPDRIAR